VNRWNNIIVDNPNIPLLREPLTTPYGVFINSPADSKMQFDPSVAKVESRDMYLPNFSIRKYEGHLTHDSVFVNQNEKGTELLGSCIFLKGSFKSLLNGQPDGIESYSRSQNFLYDPNNEYQHRTSAHSPFDFFHVSFTKECFYEFLPDNERWADELKNRIFAKQCVIGNHFTPITLAQDRAIQNILDCPLSGKLGYLMIETSIIQVIILQLQALFNKSKIEATEQLTKRDNEIVYGLKEHVTKTFLEEHSLTSLSKQFGANTNKLMNLFKKVFGKSIFQYISELRMEHAWELLENDMRVVEVARTVGYKNPNHFSTAFKNRYGIKPSEIR